MSITIIGAGLAGSEAAWQALQRGVPVKLIEMRPKLLTPAHRSGRFAELVCSNSLRGADLSNAVGLLKEELRRCGSLIMTAADATRLPAGGALAVDRERFSAYIDQKLRSHPLLELEIAEAKEIPPATPETPLIIASGPLSSPALSAAIAALIGAEHLAFYDAISPIIIGSSLQEEFMFRQSRYDKGDSADYLNIPLNQEQYLALIADILNAKKFAAHREEDRQLRPFEGCMPIEDMAARGPDTLRHGPLKPKGLRDPKSGSRPYAVVQLRFDNQEETLCSLVGLQTRMCRPDQERVLRSLPGLAEAEFVRFGSVHRNTFINSPQHLTATSELRKQPGLFFAGQISGVEGYVESTTSGMVAGINAVYRLQGRPPLVFPACSACGALLNYISAPGRQAFQPMNISFGLIPAYLAAATSKERGRSGRLARRRQTAEQALAAISALAARSSATPPLH